jgi:hypothetical protein
MKFNRLCKRIRTGLGDGFILIGIFLAFCLVIGVANRLASIHPLLVVPWITLSVTISVAVIWGDD